MTLKNVQKAPFPWFGGKSLAAPLVWELLGDVDHYVEPFAGSLAVLLNRPHLPNRPNYSETVNDLDGLVVNAWRSIQWHPEETAQYASWPTSEADLHARNIAVVNWRANGLAEKLAGSPEFCDTQMAGWWLWGSAISIAGFAASGSWTVGDDGKIVKIDRKVEGWSMQGVPRARPFLSSDGQGINNPSGKELGIFANDGESFHKTTMPELIRWFDWLSARLRHVRILNGDWSRAVTGSATKTLKVRMSDGHTGIFLDPPYADTAGRASALYSVDDLEVAHVVKRWCAQNGNDPDYRIVLAGFEGEHDDELLELGWSTYEWFSTGYLRGGMGQQRDDGDQQHRERLWASPYCFTPGDESAKDNQLTMFADE